jgi:hypothetical protein
MANGDPVQRESREMKLLPARNQLGGFGDGESLGAPANDNPQLNDLPPCLPVTDEEVTLLHQHLGREILGLFS